MPALAPSNEEVEAPVKLPLTGRMCVWIGPLRNHSRADQRICVSLYELPPYCEQCIFHRRVVPAAALRSLGKDPRAAAGGVTASGRVKSRLILCRLRYVALWQSETRHRISRHDPRPAWRHAR